MSIGRKRPRKYVGRHEVEAFSVLDLAREHLIRPGLESAGFVALLGYRTGEVEGWLPIRTRMEQLEGILEVHEPFLQAFRLEARPVKTAAKIHWRLECRGPKGLGGCGRLCRTLYRAVPLNDPVYRPFGFWACRTCTGVRFFSRADDSPSLATLAELEATIEGCQRLKEIILRGIGIEAPSSTREEDFDS